MVTLLTGLTLMCISSMPLKAQPPIRPDNQPPIRPGGPIQPITPDRGQVHEPPPPLRVDLAVTKIYADFCKCDLSDVDAFYMNKIWVRVYTPYGFGMRYGRRVESIQARVTLEYYDLAGGQKTITKTVTITPRTDVDVEIVGHPVLVKKSRGITAWVEPLSSEDTGPVVEGRGIDNRKTIYECQVLLE